MTPGADAGYQTVLPRFHPAYMYSLPLSHPLYQVFAGLQLYQFVIISFFCHKFLMISHLRDPSMLHHQNLIRHHRSGNPLCDNYLRTRKIQMPQCFLNLFFRFHIHRRGRIVQNQNRRPHRQCSCQGNSLFLSAGKACATLSDHCIISFRHL